MSIWFMLTLKTQGVDLKSIAFKGVASLLPHGRAYCLTTIILKKPVESTIYYSTTGGAYCTESKAFFTFLKLTHRVTWVASRKWVVSKKQKLALYSVH